MSGTVVTTVAPATDEAARIAADAAATARAEGTKAPAEAPKKFAGRYDSIEDLEKGYKELQAELTRAKAPAKPDEAAKPATPEAGEGEAGSAEEVLEAKGLDFNKFASSFEQHGKVTDEDYAELEKAGISRAVVDTYVQGHQALRQQTYDNAVALVGGEDAFKAMRTWATTSLNAAELTAYNDAVQKGGEAQKLALTGLKSRYEAANGREARLVSGTGSNSNSDTFASIRELSKAQADTRYGKDRDYTRSVEAKAARSAL